MITSNNIVNTLDSNKIYKGVIVTSNKVLISFEIELTNTEALLYFFTSLSNLALHV